MEFMTKLTLWNLGRFDDANPRLVCLKHYSSLDDPPAITSCAELVDCVRNILSTYELWALDWKSQLERMMVEYF